jgi:ABC-type lipoprotein release transport system permease subunit
LPHGITLSGMLIGFLYFAEYRRRFSQTARHVLVLTVIVACLFFFTAMFPSASFHFTATYQFAKYDMLINGPLKESDISFVIDRLSPYGPNCIPLIRGTADEVYTERSSLGAVDIFYYRAEDFKNIYFTYFSKELILKGEIADDSSVGIDYMNARRLGVDIGDSIRIRTRIPDGRGGVKVVFHEGTIDALFEPTNEVNGIVAPLSPDMKDLFDKNGLAATDLFIRLHKGSAENATLRLSEKSKEWLIEPLSEAYAAGKRKLEETFNRNVRYGTMWVALIVYAILVLREQAQRMARRKKTIAILFSLGMSEAALYRALALEQLFLNITTGLCGTLLGRYLMENQFGMYIPRETLYFILGYLFAIIVVVLVVSVIQLLYHLRRFDVARLLSMEQ